MKKRSVEKNFILTMTVLSVFLVVLWVLFYYITRQAFVNNMIAQAQTISDSITSSIEDELLSIDDTAYSLAHYDRIIDMMTAGGNRSFYEMGQTAAVRSESIIGAYCPADNVLVMRSDGSFYRLKGQISNTAVKRIWYLLQSKDTDIITVSVGGMTYLGCCRSVDSEEGDFLGYVVLLMDKYRLEELMSAFNEVDYIGVAVSAGTEIICSDRDMSYEELDSIRKTGQFYKEKAIGLTGFTLHTYSDETVPRSLGRYFRLALPLTMAILLVTIGFFVRYWNRHIVGPIDTIIESVGEAPDSPIPDTGEEYFDDLVQHVNDALSRIEERDRQLFESDLRIKESELVAERTLMSLLKKQINAHFTVNTLNAIRALINKGEKETAAKICDELSALLRYANAGEEYISIIEEFEVLEQYASIMQVRFPGRFSFETGASDDAAQCYIPRMLLQPLVENSINHGLAGRSGAVSVDAAVSEDILLITVTDDGAGMEASELDELLKRLENAENIAESGVKHVALLNIQKRIKLTCGEEYGLEISSEKDKGTSVIVRLPAGSAAVPENI